MLKNYFGSDDFELVSYDVTPFSSEANGFLSVRLLLQTHVIYRKTNKNLRFFIKRYPFGQELHTKFLDQMHGWQRECYLYTTFLEKLTKVFPEYVADFAPKCFLGNSDNIVLEDLTIKNYDLARIPLTLLDNDHICLIMKALAKYHAGSLAYEEYLSKQQGKTCKLFTGKEDLIKEPVFRRGEDDFLGNKWFVATMKGLRVIINKLHDSTDVPIEMVQEKLTRLSEKALESMRPQTKFRNVLGHGDLWVKNVMYQYEGSSKNLTKPIHAVMVDFQFIRYHLPVQDMLFFLYFGTSQAIRQKFFHYYIKYYHDTLAKELQKLNIDVDQISLSFEDFLKSVSYMMPLYKVHGALYKIAHCVSQEFWAKNMQDEAAFMKFNFGDKSEFVLDIFETDENYRNITTEAAEEIIESSLNPEVFREDCYRILEEDLGTTDYEFKKYSVEKSENGDNLYELKIDIRIKGKEEVLKYSVKSEPFDFPRVVKKL